MQHHSIFYYIFINIIRSYFLSFILFSTNLPWNPFPSFVVYSQHPPSCSPLCQHFARAVNSSNNQTPSQLLKALLSVTERIPPFAFCFQLQIRRFGCRKGKEYIRSKRTCCRILIFLEYFRKIWIYGGSESNFYRWVFFLVAKVNFFSDAIYSRNAMCV